MSRLQERERQLEAELRAIRTNVSSAVELDDDTVASMLGEETLRVLHTARESANQIKIRAEENAARVMREAHDETNRIRQEAEVEAARKRQDAQAEAEAEVALAKQHGREMVSEARAYRERVLADLERRTRLARQHIEELASGRERLLQVFERARLVAVDVASELQAIDGPEEFVSFAPTTGPVPLMVPASKLGAETDAEIEPAESTDDGEIDNEIDELVRSDVEPAEGAPSTEAFSDRVDEATDSIEAADATQPITGAADAPSDVTEEPATKSTKKKREGNVVALFRGRAAGDEPESDGEPTANVGDDTNDDAAADADRPDVGGLFARLRSGVPTADADIETDADNAGTEAAPLDAPTEAANPTDADAPAVATPFRRRDEALVPLIVAAARKAKRVLADEQNGALDTLRRKEPVTTIESIAPELTAHVAMYVDSVAEELAAAAAAGAAELGMNDTKTLRRTLDRAGALETARALVRTNLVTPLRDRLERSIVDGAGDNEDITKRARSVYREWKTQHIDDQLDDVFRFAYGGGLAVTVEPGAPVVWMIDPAQPACADCEDNSLAGALPSGESFPTGHTSAPAHPGCHCLTLPASS